MYWRRAFLFLSHKCNTVLSNSTASTVVMAIIFHFETSSMKEGKRAILVERWMLTRIHPPSSVVTLNYKLPSKVDFVFFPLSPRHDCRLDLPRRQSNEES
jgi:hypothetical protein